MYGLQKPQLHNPKKSGKHSGKTSFKKILQEMPQIDRTQRGQDLGAIASTLLILRKLFGILENHHLD